MHVIALDQVQSSNCFSFKVLSVDYLSSALKGNEKFFNKSQAHFLIHLLDFRLNAHCCDMD